MSARFERKKAEAKALEQRLIAEGRPADAQIVRRLRLAASAMSGTLQVYHRDNIALRERSAGE